MDKETQLYVQAIKQLRDELEAGQILATAIAEQELALSTANDLATFVSQVLDLVAVYPFAKARLRELTATLDRKFSGLPGHRQDPITFGPLVMCPEAHCSYRTRLRSAGERCPKHNLELVVAVGGTP